MSIIKSDEKKINHGGNALRFDLFPGYRPLLLSSSFLVVWLIIAVIVVSLFRDVVGIRVLFHAHVAFVALG